MEKLEKYVETNVDRLMVLSTSIGKIYQKLEILEKSNQKDSAKYRDTLNHLKIAVELEDSIYELLPTRKTELEKIVDLLNDKYKLQQYHPTLDYVYLNDESKSAYRIIGKLNDELIDIEYQESKQDNLLEKYDIYDILMYGLEIFENKDKLYNMIFKDIIYSNLAELESSVGHVNLLTELHKFFNHGKNVEELYISYKYNLSFIDKNGEVDFIKKNFVTENHSYINSHKNAYIVDETLDDYITEKYLLSLFFTNQLIDEISYYNQFDWLLSSNVSRKLLTMSNLIVGLNKFTINDLLHIQSIITHQETYKNMLPECRNEIIITINLILAIRDYVNENSFQKEATDEKDCSEKKKTLERKNKRKGHSSEGDGKEN